MLIEPVKLPVSSMQAGTADPPYLALPRLLASELDGFLASLDQSMAGIALEN